MAILITSIVIVALALILALMRHDSQLYARARRRKARRDNRLRRNET